MRVTQNLRPESRPEVPNQRLRRGAPPAAAAALKRRRAAQTSLILLRVRCHARPGPGCVVVYAISCSRLHKILRKRRAEVAHSADTFWAL